MIEDTLICITYSPACIPHFGNRMTESELLFRFEKPDPFTSSIRADHAARGRRPFFGKTSSVVIPCAVNEYYLSGSLLSGILGVFSMWLWYRALKYSLEGRTRLSASGRKILVVYLSVVLCILLIPVFTYCEISFGRVLRVNWWDGNIAAMWGSGSGASSELVSIDEFRFSRGWVLRWPYLTRDRISVSSYLPAGIAVVLGVVLFGFTRFRLWIMEVGLDSVECSSCGYSLVGLDGGVCPECGGEV